MGLVDPFMYGQMTFFLVSYPKSGNTWIRFLIGNLVDPSQPVTFANIEDRVPDIYQNTVKHLQQIPRPRILKSHEYFDPRYKKVIYIIRDPKDVVVSYYHYHIKVRTIDENYPLDQYVTQFVAGELSPYGSWGEHVGSWLGARKSSDGFVVVRYEDLLENTKNELQNISAFLNLRSNTEQLNRAISLSSFENMRKLEQEQAHLWKPTRISRIDKPFVRKGQAGAWRSELHQSLARRVDTAWGNILDHYNYKNDDSPKN